MDEDELGVALSVMNIESVGIDLSMSLPIYSVFRTSALSADSVKWEAPVFFDKNAELSDIQIID